MLLLRRWLGYVRIVVVGEEVVSLGLAMLNIIDHVRLITVHVRLVTHYRR